MKLAISVPSGFHTREVLMPLKHIIENDNSITSVTVITPATNYKSTLFPGYSDKFDFIENPKSQAGHDKLLKEISATLLLTNTAGLDDKDVPLLRSAKTLNVLSCTFISSWDNIWKMDRSKRAHPLVIADHVIVWNDIMKSHLLHLFPELAQNQVVVIGPPRFDFFSHENKIPTKRELFEYIGTNISDKLIHFATTELYPMDYVVKPLYQHLKNKNVSLFASVHPGGDIDKHNKLSARYKAKVAYSFGRNNTSPIPEFQYNPTFEEIYMQVALFKYTDLLINHSSTVALESFAGNTPVININYGRPLDWWAWRKSIVKRDFKEHYRDILADQSTRVVKNMPDLITATDNYLSDPGLQHDARQFTLKKMITTIDGTASQKLLDYLKTLN